MLHKRDYQQAKPMYITEYHTRCRTSKDTKKTMTDVQEDIAKPTTIVGYFYTSLSVIENRTR